MTDRKEEAIFEEIDTRADEQGSTSQRREHPRFKVSMDVGIGTEHNFYKGFAENISAGGLFVATHRTAQVGEILEFEVTLPETDQVIRGKGEVRWLRVYSETSNVSPGFGMRFVDLNPASIMAIEEFLKNHQALFFDDD